MKKIADLPHIRRRPIGEILPTVLTQGVDGDGRLIDDCVVNVVKPVVKPSQQSFVKVDQRCGSEVDVAGSTRTRHTIREEMPPRSYDKSLPISRLFKFAVMFDAAIGVL